MDARYKDNSILKSVRVLRGKRQIDIAVEVGLKSQRDYAAIELGECKPTPEIAEKIATALQTDVTRLFPELEPHE